MIKVYLMKIGLKWINRHKSRYILSWFSFALVSIVLICIYSISTSISDGVLKQISINPLSYQAHVKNQRLIQGEMQSDLTENSCEQMAYELGASSYRVLFNCDLSLLSIDGEIVESIGTINTFDAGNPLVLTNEIESKSVDYKGDLEWNGYDIFAVVTTDFLSLYGYTIDDAIGKELSFMGENGGKFSATVSAVLYNINPQCRLGNASIYVGITSELGNEIFFDDIQPFIISYDFEKDVNMDQVKKQITAWGYPHSMEENNVEKLRILADTYDTVGSFLGIIMAIVCMMSLINSVMITIHENTAFINMLRLLGVTNFDCKFLVCFITAVQGAIGGAIGFFASYIGQEQLGNLVKKMKLALYDEILIDFKVNIEVSLWVMGTCIIVSILAGIVSNVISSKEAIVIVNESEIA